MNEVIISNTEDRVVRFGISEVERYRNCCEIEKDPWWNVHVYVKKPGIEFDSNGESMTEYDLLELSRAIREAKNRDRRVDEHISFMEPDYSFDIAKRHAILHINLKYTDSLNIWLTRENMNDIADYIDAMVK